MAVLPCSKWLSTSAGTIQGGFTAMLAESAMTSAAFSTAPADTAVATLDFKVNYLRPVFPDGDEMTARARILHRGRTLVDRRGRAHQRRGQAGRPRHGLVDVPAGPARRTWSASSSARAPPIPRTIPGFAERYSRPRGPLRLPEEEGRAGDARSRGRRSSRPPSQGTAIPDSQSVSMGEPGWTEPGSVPDGRPARHRQAGGDPGGAARARDRPGPEGPDDRRLGGSGPAERRCSRRCSEGSRTRGGIGERDPLAASRQPPADPDG